MTNSRFPAGGPRVDNGPDLGGLVGREAVLLGVFLQQRYNARVLDAVDLVAGDMAVHRFDPGPRFADDPAGLPGRALQLFL